MSPAALATMLGQRGLALTPGQLKDEVFIPGREGSLQLRWPPRAATVCWSIRRKAD